jgi:anti-sigma regulatory factor (Ser/Thr protein kinase)
VDIFDLGITALLATAGILVGRAVASYEIFTGKALPRGGLARQWRNSLVLAGSFGLLVGGSLMVPIDTTVLLMLAVILLTTLYAVHSWRVYEEREQSMRRLRPFVTSEGLYARLLVAGAAADDDMGAPFRALCAEVLGARVAFLVPVGPLAGPALAYPQGIGVPSIQHGKLAGRVRSPDTLCFPVESAAFAGAVWGIPLWSERGLLGLFLLGPKSDGSLYTQEEIELARATGERLIDTQISTAMARRLVVLQRAHLAETQVVDRRARRLLHDEILPRLHAVVLALSTAQSNNGERALRSVHGSNGEALLKGSSFRSAVPEQGSPEDAVQRAVGALVEVHQQIADLLRATPPALAPEVARLGALGALRQAVDVEFGGDFDAVTWDVEPDAERLARTLSAMRAEVLFYAAREAIRNAARHGRRLDAGAELHLTISARVDAEFALTIEDDGVGFDAPRGTSEAGGHGLALHTTLMAVVGGSLTIESVPGTSTRVRLSFPLPIIYGPSPVGYGQLAHSRGQSAPDGISGSPP